MSNDIKNTLTTLLNDELIIPEIQRDYVWGNNEIVLRRFLKNIFNNNKENKKGLDIGFFYAYKVYQDTKKEENKGIYALIDGQQRITTLVLLYWYLGIGKDYIKKFKFKVRENCNNFLEKLLEKDLSNVNEGRSISEKIKNCIWYLSIWDNDPTVKSMLKALDIIENEFNKITENKEYIKNNIENKIIFTCITNDNRSLEKEYISLNARGRELEKYEKLKAILVEDMENDKKKYEYLEKWEKDWQDILWECKGDNVYNTDNIWNAVLYWARDIFVIENNICKPKIEKENNKEKEKIDFDFDLISIKDEYKNDLLTILDWIIPTLKFINSNKIKIKNYYEAEYIDYLDRILAGDTEENYDLGRKNKVLFYSLLYLCKNKNDIISAFDLEKIRLFRNLVFNTDSIDDTSKNAVNALKSLHEIIELQNINEFNSIKKLSGINQEQLLEEKLKLNIFVNDNKYEDIIKKYEKLSLFRGKLKNIFIILLSSNFADIHKYHYEKDFFIKNNDSLLKCFYDGVEDLFKKYKETDNIKNEIWGELLLYNDIYRYNGWDRIKLVNNDETLGLLFLILQYHKSKLSMEDFLLSHRKKAIEKIKENLRSINCELQLYILYLLRKCNFYNKNFGVLYKEKNPDLEEKYYNNSPFDTKFVFQPYKYRWVGGQAPIFFNEKVNLEKKLEKYL